MNETLEIHAHIGDKGHKSADASDKKALTEEPAV